MAEPLTHEQASGLLPWVANGTLSPAEDAAVREHAADCVLCRRDLLSLERVAAALSEARDTQPANPPDMRRINARIDALLARERRGPAFVAALRDFAANPWRAAFAAQTLFALVLIAGLWAYLREPPAVYQTLTTAEELAEGHYLRLVFDPHLSEAEIAERLKARGLAVARGPSAAGVYTVRFDDDVDAMTRRAVLDALRRDADVRFAQPVSAAGGEQ